jgi:uncharacterized metal-binding protein YceD (DUF177 family)
LEYDFGNEFFKAYGSDLVSSGSFHADVMLNKHETFIEADFHIAGQVELICDRSLEPFDFLIDEEHKIVFKFGDHDEEVTDEIIMIHRDTATLELGQYVYEFITLAVPLKKLHPRFKDEPDDEDDDAEVKLIYSSGPDSPDSDGPEEGPIDPRWEALKKLK